MATWICPKLVNIGSPNFFSSIVLIKTITGKNPRTYLCLPSEIIIFTIFPIIKPLFCAKIFCPIIDPQNTTVHVSFNAKLFMKFVAVLLQIIKFLHKNLWQIVNKKNNDWLEKWAISFSFENRNWFYPLAIDLSKQNNRSSRKYFQ